MTRFLHAARDAGPYALLVLLVPGGSLIALVVWLLRRKSAKAFLAQLHHPNQLRTFAE